VAESESTTDEALASTADMGPDVLREYALLADGERGVLVGPRGDFVWMCFPRWHSEAIFSSLLGGPGSYAVTPQGRFVWGGYYEEGSLIWRSRWVTTHGIVECREALAFPCEGERATVLRRIEALSGAHRLDVLLDLRSGFGEHSLEALDQRDGSWSGRTGEVHARWSGAPEAERRELDGGTCALAAVVDLEEGETHDLVLELALEPLEDRPAPAPDVAWSATEAAWQDVVPDLPLRHARRDARHAYAVSPRRTA